jgi:S-adenosylmethionine-diacylgycerolhomoserine-N-methlytransferase
MEISEGDTVLEVGCGTGRNLIKLANKHPNVNFYGLDASTEMLKTAQGKVNSLEDNVADRIMLRHSMAEDLDYSKTFGLRDRFDVIFYSYALSMIPTFKDAVDSSIENLKDGKRMYVVDFWDQKDLPKAFGYALRKWLSLFHVKFNPELFTYLNELNDRNLGEFSVEPVMRRYAYIGKFDKAKS